MQFNQEASIKPYSDMNTELRTKTKNEFKRKLLQVDEQFSIRKNHGGYKKA